MNRPTFVGQLERLVAAFGEKAINSEKSRLLWEKFKDVEDDVFTQVVDWLVLNQRQTPVYDDFQRELNKTYERNKKTQRPFDPHAPVCSACSGSGWILETPRGSVVPNAYRCGCTAPKIDVNEIEDSAFSDQDRSHMIRTIIDRITGRVGDDEWRSFKENIDLQIKNHESSRRFVVKSNA